MNSPGNVGSAPNPAPSTAWYESNFLWVPLGFLLTLVASKLGSWWWFVIAWVCLSGIIWREAARTREIWLVRILGILLLGAALWGLNFWLRPSASPPVATAKNDPPKPAEQPKPVRSAPPPQDSQRDTPSRPRRLVSHSSEVKPGNPAIVLAPVQSHPPVVLNSAPGGFAVSGGTLYNPSVTNYAPPTRHLTVEQKTALGDPAIKEACNVLNMPLDIQWEPVEEAGTYGKEILAAVDKSIVGWRGAMDDSPTPDKGLILGTNDPSNPCYLKLKEVFDAHGIAYRIGVLPKPDTTPRTVWYGNKQVQVSQPPQAPRTLIRVGIIG